jgi:hypothetical protein
VYGEMGAYLGNAAGKFGKGLEAQRQNQRAVATIATTVSMTMSATASGDMASYPRRCLSVSR